VEEAEMLRDVLLRRAGCLAELLDARIAGAKPVEQADAHRLAEQSEPLGDQLDHGLGKGMGKL
jgi:hypothetical protein